MKALALSHLLEFAQPQATELDCRRVRTGPTRDLRLRASVRPIERVDVVVAGVRYKPLELSNASYRTWQDLSLRITVRGVPDNSPSAR
jgi:hypothetical protein